MRKKEHLTLFKKKCQDKNSKVRTALLRILGNYEKPELIEFFKEQFKKDDSYLAQAEALRSIGKCGDKSQIPFLGEAAKMKSPRDVINRAAEWALKELEEGM